MSKWKKSPVDIERVRNITELHKLDTLTATMLTRREMLKPEQIAYFLENDERFLHNPMLFPQMEQAVERVLRAAEEGEKVLVCGDKDADGITSTVLMVESLRSLGLEPDWHVPVGEEDYGLNSTLLQSSAAENTTLVIAVDCGITDFAEVELANKHGMDVLIFDHHLPRENSLPSAYAIINPKLSGEYPFDGLCAAAVVSKFQWALCLASTDLWCEEFCLVHAREIHSDSSIVIEALRMRNLLEIRRITLSTEDGSAGRDKFLHFSEGLPLLVYGESIQMSLISRFFHGAEVHVIDVEPQIAAMFPGLKGQSVEELMPMSRLLRYFPEKERHIAVLGNLVATLHSRTFSSSFNLWRNGLDLVAIGTLADLMPLVNENRILVNLGIDRLAGTDGIDGRRVALRELLIRQKLHYGRVDSVEISWRICPLVNASGRMGRADTGVELLLSREESRIVALADELVNLNKKRRSLSDYFWDKICPVAYESMKILQDRMTFVIDEEVPRGITGILAYRLLKNHGVPAVVIARCGEMASGSIRCDTRMNAVAWLESMAPLLSNYGGHPQAGGFRLPYHSVEQLMLNSREWLSANLMKTATKDPILIDAELSHDEFNKLGSKTLDSLINRLEPYGQGFQPIVFLTRAVPIHDASLMGKSEKNHLKLTVSLGSAKWPALWWNGADRYGKDIHIDRKVDLVYHIGRDRWRGENARILTILEASPCET